MEELAHKKTHEEVSSSQIVDQTKVTKLSRLILLLHCTAIAGYITLVIATLNKRLTTRKQENRYWERVSQKEENHHKQNKLVAIQMY